MSKEVQFKSNIEDIIFKIDYDAEEFLEEAKYLISKQASDLSPVETGKLAQSFVDDSFVDTNKLIAYIGSTLDYALYQEKGTGEYAVSGRKGGWTYKNKDGNFVKTRGVKPKRMLEMAFEYSKPKLENRAKHFMKD